MGRITFAARPHLSENMRSTLHNMLSWFMQRLPIIIHFIVGTIAFVGPVLAPRTVALLQIITQAVFSGSQARGAYGLFQAWMGSRQHSMTDWALFWQDQKNKLERDGMGHGIISYDSVQHLILVPAYKEEMSTLKETLGVLASHPLAASTYRICLGMEEREVGAATKAETLVQFYRAQHVFLDICYSMHPGTIVGESAGKSSNVNWAARWMSKRVPVSQHGRCIITVMDSDTCFAADYFLGMAVRYALLPAGKRRFTQFVPPIIFDRNGPDVPVFTRLTDVFWSCAGIGGIYPGSAIRIPTSAYSVSLDLAKFCNFWDTGPESIGEDMHFFIKGMFETKGHINSVTIYSPASQMHVVGPPARGKFANYYSDMKARWDQAVRHMWGSLDFGFAWSRVLTWQFGPSVRNPTYVALDDDDGSPVAERDQALDTRDAEAVRSLFEAKLKAAEEAGLVRAVSPAGESVITESSVSSVDMFGLTRAKKFTSIDSPITPHHNTSFNSMNGRLSPSLASLASRPVTPANAPVIMAPAPKPGIVQPPSDDENDSDFDAEERSGLFADRMEAPPDAVNNPLYATVEDKSIKVFPIIVLLTRLYEAHLLVVHLLLFGLVLNLYPTVVYQDGSVQHSTPGKAISLKDCWHSLMSQPFAATRAHETPGFLREGKTPVWVMPDSVLCGKQIAGIFGIIGVLATVMMFIFHDMYHHVCAVERWRQSENIRQIVLRERHRQGAVTSADKPSDMPARYLGIRPSQTCVRKWPVVFVDFIAVPAAIFYGAAPLVWAQINHLTTNKLMYTVSAKGKGLVVSTRLAEGESVEVGGRRWSVEHHRIASSNQELAVAVPHRQEPGYLPKPALAD